MLKYRNDNQTRYINYILASSKERQKAGVSKPNPQPKYLVSKARQDDNKENVSSSKTNRERGEKGYLDKLKDLYGVKAQDKKSSSNSFYGKANAPSFRNNDSNVNISNNELLHRNRSASQFQENSKSRRNLFSELTSSELHLGRKFNQVIPNQREVEEKDEVYTESAEDNLIEENKLLLSNIRKLNLELQNEKESSSQLKCKVAELQSQLITFCELSMMVVSEFSQGNSRIKSVLAQLLCQVETTHDSNPSLFSSNHIHPSIVIPRTTKSPNYSKKENSISIFHNSNQTNDQESYKSHRSHRSEQDSINLQENRSFHNSKPERSQYSVIHEEENKNEETEQNDYQLNVSRNNSFMDSSSTEISQLKLKILRRRNRRKDDVSADNSFLGEVE